MPMVITGVPFLVPPTWSAWSAQPENITPFSVKNFKIGVIFAMGRDIKVRVADHDRKDATCRLKPVPYRQPTA